MEFRRATASDVPDILQIMSSAFDRPPGSDKYQRDKRRLENEIATHWVLVRAGQVVGATHIVRDDIQVGGSTIAKADVGEVCIAPDYQGEGLGTALMQNVVKQLRSDGYPISRLGGYRRFYERFGWLPFPRGYVDFALSGLTSRGGYTDPVSYLDRPTEDARIRPYDGSRDAEPCAEHYTAFNSNRTGAKPARSFGPDAGDPWRVVYERGGVVRAYVFASRNAPPHTLLSPAASISDGACDPEDTQPLGEALRHILRQAAIAGADSVRARLPLDASLYNLYRDASCGFVPTLWQSSEGGNMLQILSLGALFEAIAPELQDRLQATNQPSGRVDLRVNTSSIRLIWNGTELMIDAGEQDAIPLGQDDLMKLVLGLVPIEHLLHANTENIGLLRSLFPVQGTATGVWG